MRADGFSYGVGIVIGSIIASVTWYAAISAKPLPTCTSVHLEQLAFTQCLKMRPACSSVTVDDFIKYQENKNWLEGECPALSGDDFLSQ